MSRAADDPLAGAAWSCAASEPGSLDGPAALAGAKLEWLACELPGTAAAALRAAGRWHWGSADEALLDGLDWWFRATFAPPGRGPWQLEIGGLATLADVWLDGEHVLHSESMFLAHSLPIGMLEGQHELVIRCAALDAAPVPRQPRARWRSRLVRSQGLRFRRTSLLGRMPGGAAWAAPVGPWRALRIVPAAAPAVLEQAIQASCDGGGGRVSARITIRSLEPLATATLVVDGSRAPLTLSATGGDTWLAQGTLELTTVERWWPHTHGAQPLYGVALELDGERHALGRIGFRTIELDQADGRFALQVNGVRIFCRGGCWTPPDPVSFTAPAEVRSTVELARWAGMNMLRVAGYTCYEGPAFWDACDELGLLVWQDCMFASTDVPATPELVAATELEVRQVFGELAGRPSLAIACGSSETYQQAAMFGLAPGTYDCELLEQTIPQTLAAVAPGVAYVPSSPSGGEPPFTPDAGVAHYFGVGAYLRPLADARLAGVRFASECLSFATPPEPATIRAEFGSEALAGHHPRWKLGVARDAGTSWDFEDVVSHYLRDLFAVDPLGVRYADPERALDLARATVCELMSATMSEWRRPLSSCDGALVLSLRDLWPGAGWGLIDAHGQAKAPLYALRRVLAPTAVLLIDEGLAGLDVHVVHDRGEPLRARLRLMAFNPAGVQIELSERELELGAHGALKLRAEELLGGFRDLTRAYRFGPAPYDVIAALLLDADGGELACACYLPQGPARPRQADLGMTASARPAADGTWQLTLRTQLFAQYVAVDVERFAPSDGWFHLLPGSSRTVTLLGEGEPRGFVRALNGPSVAISLERGA